MDQRRLHTLLVVHGVITLAAGLVLAAASGVRASQSSAT